MCPTIAIVLVFDHACTRSYLLGRLEHEHSTEYGAPYAVPTAGTSAGTSFFIFFVPCSCSQPLFLFLVPVPVPLRTCPNKCSLFLFLVPVPCSGTPLDFAILRMVLPVCVFFEEGRGSFRHGRDRMTRFRHGRDRTVTVGSEGGTVGSGFASTIFRLF